MDITKSNRIEWVDILKGIAILWLMVYHFYVLDWLRSPVPVFFFLSGLFFSEGKSFGSFVMKKTKALLIPLLFFFILGVCASFLKCKRQGEIYAFPPLWRFFTLIPADAAGTNPLGVGAIWFLVSLFEIYIIYYLLRMVSKNGWCLFAASIALFVLSCITMQFYAHGTLFYLFYTFGYCIFFIVAHLQREKILYGDIPAWLLLLSILLYLIRFIDLSIIMENSPVFGGVSGIRWLISETGLIITLVWLCKRLSSIKQLCKTKIYAFMLFEGRNSLTVMGTHLLAMSVVLLFLKMIIPDGLLF